MLERFSKYIKDNKLCSSSDRILLAVSGGIDSVVMLDLFLAAGYKAGIAHCNFHLRAEESDQDVSFVKSLAEIHSIEFHSKDFQTGETASSEGISIQMAARNLRYTWFEEVRETYKYNLIATAHNQDDVLETFFINLSRGTGIRGLTGIPARAGKVIRPLLFASREDIVKYAEEKGLSYREDSSNASEKYLRNRVRHKLLPMLEDQNPSFRKSLIDTITKLSETEKLFSEEMRKLKNSLLIRKGDRFSILIGGLEKLESRRTILYEILADFNFSSASIDDINDAISAVPGKKFFSPTHRLVKDREELIITPLIEEEERKYYLELSDGQLFNPVDLEWMIVDSTEKFRIPREQNIACLDLELLDFPLILRHWQKGDYFQPFGMTGIKKISDFLIDEKVSIPDKEKIWLLASGQKIVWVVGHRIDERFRITDDTRQVLLIKYSPAGL
ncbi:tRNA lysidine(34) synthetase TilS [Bacteroidota bacterium]